MQCIAFYILYYLISKNKVLSVFTALGIATLCVFFASKINFEEDINQIIPKNEKSDLTAKVLKQLNFSDKIIVIIENKSNEDSFQLSETADTFLQKTEPLQKYISSVQGKVNDDEISETFDLSARTYPVSEYRRLQRDRAEDPERQHCRQVENNYISLASLQVLSPRNSSKRSFGTYFSWHQEVECIKYQQGF
ncbi:hypothetical protein EJ377_08805 [Chryseobacterium arthrosphaerae]|uniref:Uncharacterized protein n=1 Tax=Chryseobacterium arthrosphaerae TaxID=651561 RepID=A0A3S0N5K9_9FLAO|nr:hypothetical protein EJ377_08805 [Chryseobacterium arthrosphaerae]